MTVFKELAKWSEKSETLELAKFDASLNEVEGLTFEAYPTLILYSRGHKQGIEFKTAP